MRVLFESASAAWIIPSLVAVGAVLIAVDEFRFADGVFVLGALWAITWLWFQPYKNTRFDVAVVTITLCIAVGLIYFTERYRITRILAENHGLLEPADDLVVGCQVPSGAFRTLLLGNVGMATDVFPHDIVTIFDPSAQKPIPLITIDIINNMLAVTATVSSADGRTIATIENNEWTVNPNNIMRKYNPDLSSLSVYDQYNKKVLDIRYRNPYVIEIYAHFIHRGKPIDISKDGINAGSGVSNLCIVVRDNKVPFIYIN